MYWSRASVAQHFVDQRAILDHEQVRVENAGVLGADGFGDALLHLENLRAGGDERRLEARDLRRDLAFLDAALRRRLVVRAIDEDRAAGDARRDADAVKALFLARAGASLLMEVDERTRAPVNPHRTCAG